MSAGRKYEYKWADGIRVKKPLRCSAPKYIEYLMEWVQTTLDDERLFPVDSSEPFPSNIRDTIRTMFKRLFRVYAHMYVEHFAALQRMGAEPHLNTCFRHFILFVREFDLIEPQELAPLQVLIDKVDARCHACAAAASTAGSGLPAPTGSTTGTEVSDVAAPTVRVAAAELAAAAQAENLRRHRPACHTVEVA